MMIQTCHMTDFGRRFHCVQLSASSVSASGCHGNTVTGGQLPISSPITSLTRSSGLWTICRLDREMHVYIIVRQRDNLQ